MTIPSPSISSATPPFRRGLGLGVTAFAADPGGDDDHDDDPPPSPSTPATPLVTSARPAGAGSRKHGDNFYLSGERGLAKGWKQRARDSIAAVRLAARIEAEQRPATVEEQRQLIRFTGFGASELANGVFRRPGETEFAQGWDEIGADLQDAVDDADYASLARCTQYAHFTPEFVVQAIWAAVLRLGWRGGRVLEPGAGTGLFLGADARRSARGLPRHRRRARSRHRPHRAAAAAAGAHRRRRFRTHRAAATLRPGDRQSALLRSHRALGPHAAFARPAPPRLLHRQGDQPAEAGGAGRLRHLARHDGQGGWGGARADRAARRSRRRDPSSRRQLSRRCRHRCRRSTSCSSAGASTASRKAICPGSISRRFARRPRTRAPFASIAGSRSIPGLCSGRTRSPPVRSARPIPAIPTPARTSRPRWPPPPPSFRTPSMTASPSQSTLRPRTSPRRRSWRTPRASQHARAAISSITAMA